MAVLGGAGHHLATLSNEQFEVFAKLTFSSQFFYALVVGLVKLSITWNLKSIFDIPGFRITSYIVMGCSVAWTLQTMGVPVFLCRPISQNWDSSQTGSCGNSTVAFTSVSVVDIITDILILILPLRPLSKLKMATGYKLAIGAIFSSVIL